MARLPLVDENDPNADPEAVAILRSMESTFGYIVNLERVMVHHPTLMQGFFNMMRMLYLESHLSPKQTELPYLTSTMTLKCFY